MDSFVQHIQKFKFDEMCENPKICIIGKRGSGKSYLQADILHYFKHIPATIISSTEESNPFFCQFKNAESIHYKCDSAIITEILENQKKKIYESSIETSNDTISETNQYNDTINQLLDKIGNIVASSMVTNNLTNCDVETMKNMVDQLISEKQKLFVKNQLIETYQTIGHLLNQDNIETNQLNELKNSINNINIKSLSPNMKDRSNVKTSMLKYMLFLDDCMPSKWAKDEQFTNLLFNSKSLDLSCVLAMQYPLGLAPEVRSDFDYIFLFAEDYVSNLKRIYEHYAGFFPDFSSFRHIFDQLTKGYGVMVIKNKSIGSSIFDKIAFYKADNIWLLC